MTPFFMAWGMFWIVPCPYRHWDSSRYAQMLACLPLIGLLIGGVWALCAFLLDALGAPRLFAGAVLSAVPWLMTGFIHLDGYMDCSDAVLSRRDREERIRILKDSHVGSFAVIMLVLLVLLTFSLLAGADTRGKYLCLTCIPACTRCVSAMCVLMFRKLGTSSYARLERSAQERRAALACALMLVIFAALPVLLCGRAGLCAAVGAVGCILTILSVRRDLGGMSGDISGCGITVGEMCACAALSLL